MAKYGLSITRDDGRLWMSPDVTPMNFIEKITITLIGLQSTRITTSINENIPIMIFVNYSSKFISFAIEKSNQNGKHSYLATRNTSSDSVTATFYIFAPTVPKLSKYGINFFNELGDLTYSSEMRPLEIIRKVIPGNQFVYDVDLGVNIAVAPFLGSFQTEFQSNQYIWHSNWTGASGTIGFCTEARRILGGAPRTVLTQNGFFYIETDKYN